MTEQKDRLSQLSVACWKDEAIKARFLADPKAVLAEYDMPVADGIDVKVVENDTYPLHIIMPAPPAGETDKLKWFVETVPDWSVGSSADQTVSDLRMRVRLGMKRRISAVEKSGDSRPPEAEESPPDLPG